MTCDICGRGSCTESFHTLEEQRRYEPAVALFEKAREMRQKIRDEIAEEEDEAARALAAEAEEPDEDDAGLWCDDLHGASG